MNQLHKETSPYLLQHASNPVHWRAWNEESLALAKKIDRPILLSIGYSTCHWCHVMERESFEDPEVAEFMNNYFVNIKVDREERPDIDQIYMSAVQILTGGGGWPLNCFLTPDGRPFFGGTYFPPKQKYGRPSWSQVLQRMAYQFLEKRKVVEDQADKLLQHIKNHESRLTHFLESPYSDYRNTGLDFDEINNILIKHFDTIHGGFDQAPKFPSTMTLTYLLNHHSFHDSKNLFDHTTFTLQAMIAGGIYDHLGGGFARYATDNAWRIPHFEKMLYDNALLIPLLSKIYRVTHDEVYKNVALQTLDFLYREMKTSEGGFASALDADSEGVEGKYYVWDYTELYDLIDEEVFLALYDVTPEGNWEGTNILFAHPDKVKILFDTRFKSFARFREKLLKYRMKRITPSLDDKVILAWNSMMHVALCESYKTFGREVEKNTIIDHLEFIIRKFQYEDGGWYHSYRDGKAGIEGFLDDYAWTIIALLAHYELFFDLSLLDKAKEIADYALDIFYDEDDALMYFNSTSHNDSVIRPKESFDSAMPSSNAVMASCLLRLSILLGEKKYDDIAKGMLKKMRSAMEQYPLSFSYWVDTCMQSEKGFVELAIIGEGAKLEALKLQRLYFPDLIIMASECGGEDYPLLKDRALHLRYNIIYARILHAGNR